MSDHPMSAARVERTLVKSPPELWAELSDEACLARHLCELGEIRITRALPEREVRWAAGSTTGSATLEPCGWGTRVTLAATVLDATADPPPAPAPAGLTAPVAGAMPGTLAGAGPPPPVAAAPAPVAAAGPPVPAAPPPSVAAPPPRTPCEAAGDEVAPAPRAGFFARLLGRLRPAEAAAPDPVLGARAVRHATTTAAAPSDPVGAPPTDPAGERREQAPSGAGAPPSDPSAARAPARAPSEISAISVELREAEEAAGRPAGIDLEELLSAVLDRLGAAHHRPFSRA